MPHSHHQVRGIRNGDSKIQGHRSTTVLVLLGLENNAIKKLCTVQPVLQPVDYEFFFMALTAQSRAMASSFLRFFEITHNDTPQSIGLLWTSDQPVAETSTWQHTTFTRQTSMPPAGFEPTISAGEQPQTYALDRAATGTGRLRVYKLK